MRVLDPATKCRLLICLDAGQGIREAARNAGVNRGTARRYKKMIGERNCDCGQPSWHRGWCAYRVLRSKERMRWLAENSGGDFTFADLRLNDSIPGLASDKLCDRCGCELEIEDHRVEELRYRAQFYKGHEGPLWFCIPCWERQRIERFPDEECPTCGGWKRTASMRQCSSCARDLASRRAAETRTCPDCKGPKSPGAQRCRPCSLPRLLEWPYIQVSTPETELLETVAAVLPAGLPRALREDAGQELLTQLLAGEISTRDLRNGAVRRALANSRRGYQNRWSMASLDAGTHWDERPLIERMEAARHGVLLPARSEYRPVGCPTYRHCDCCSEEYRVEDVETDEGICGYCMGRVDESYFLPGQKSQQ